MCHLTRFPNTSDLNYNYKVLDFIKAFKESRQKQTFVMDMSAKALVPLGLNGHMSKDVVFFHVYNFVFWKRERPETDDFGKRKNRL